MKGIIILAAVGLTLGGCATNKDGSINWAQTNANVAADTALAKQVGTDIVTFDCSNASLIYVIAKDAGAASRVQSALAANAQIAADACPSLVGTSAKVVVQTGSVVGG